MKSNDAPKIEKKKNGSEWLTIVLSCFAGTLVLFVIVFAVYSVKNNSHSVKPEVTATVQTTEASKPQTTAPKEETSAVTETAAQTTTVPTETRPPKTTAAPPETEATMVPELAEIYEENPDIAGWITIEGTVVDYPVMYTPEDGEKYLYKNIKGSFDFNGLPFIEDDCSMEPESDNIIIYGHNMLDGKMFASLMDYSKIEYWEEHPLIRFSTLYEEREYEVIAAFYDRVYYKYENCFKFYQFIDAEDEDHYNEAISYFLSHSVYDTGVTAEYGDKLITLVTCSYHVKNGRFVVVAREISEERQN